MSNKKFKVSGDKTDLLMKTIDLVFLQAGSVTKAKSWKVIAGTGLAFYWHKGVKDAHQLPVDLDAAGVFAIVKQWIDSEEAKNMTKRHTYHGGDGSTSNGWEVTNYEQENDSFYQILVIKPIEIYYGK